MITELELITYLFNEKLFPYAKSNIKYLEEKYKYDQSNVVNYKLVYILNNIERINKYSKTEFELDCRTLQVSDDVLKLIDSYYDKGQSLSEEEISKTVNVLCDIISQEVINVNAKEHSDNPSEFIRDLSKFNPDNIVSISSEYHHGSILSEIPYQELKDKVEDTVIKSSLPFVNKHMGAGGYLPNTVNMITAKPGLGKTLLGMQETLAFAKQGKKVYYAAIGDISEMHVMTRMTSLALGIPLNQVILNWKWFWKSLLQNEEWSEAIKNIYVDYLKPDSVSCNRYLADLKANGFDKEYQIFFFDYDANFGDDSGLGDDTIQMYLKGGDTYNALKNFATELKPEAISKTDYVERWVFVMAQPKPAYWNNEYIPLEGASESSKKQHIIDTMLTMGDCRTNQNNLINIALVKNRNGTLGHSYALIDRDLRFQELNDEMFSIISGSAKQITFNKSSALTDGQITFDSIKQQYENNLSSNGESSS